MGGGTLKKLISSQMARPHSTLYSHADALRWMCQVAEALAYLHSAIPIVRIVFVCVSWRSICMRVCFLECGAGVQQGEQRTTVFGLLSCFSCKLVVVDARHARL